MTLAELRTAAGLKCTLPAIHHVLRKLDLTYKKRRSTPASRPGPTSPAPGGRGEGASRDSTRPGSSSLTSRGRKRTSPVCADAPGGGAGSMPRPRRAAGRPPR
jgi:hypothetical protein